MSNSTSKIDWQSFLLKLVVVVALNIAVVAIAWNAAGISSKTLGGLITSSLFGVVSGWNFWRLWPSVWAVALGTSFVASSLLMGMVTLIPAILCYLVGAKLHLLRYYRRADLDKDESRE